jgi:hypothetical protein
MEEVGFGLSGIARNEGSRFKTGVLEKVSFGLPKFPHFGPMAKWQNLKI